MRGKIKDHVRPECLQTVDMAKKSIHRGALVGLWIHNSAFGTVKKTVEVMDTYPHVFTFTCKIGEAKFRGSMGYAQLVINVRQKGYQPIW